MTKKINENIIKYFKTKILILLFLFFLCTSVAQTIRFSDSIQWQNNKTTYNLEGDTETMLYFSNAFNRSFDNFPVYFIKKDINSDIIINNVSLLNTKYAPIAPNDLQGVLHIENIKEEPEVKAYLRTFRKKNNISFELVPLRKNPGTGIIERLVYFEAEISYRQSMELKTKKEYTYNSKLSSGRWYKIKLSSNGIYKITYEQLTEMGFNNFNNIGVFGYGGMLPKIVANDVYDDLPERPILKVDANNDGIFNEGDYILFYADGPHNYHFGTTNDAYHDFHLYSDFAHYFISDRGTWKQAQPANSLSEYNIEVNKYDDYRFLEKDSINLINSGRRWFWRLFDYHLSYNFSHNFPNTSTQDTAIVKVKLAARSSSPSSFTLSINGQQQNLIQIGSVGTGSTAAYAQTNNLNTFRILPSSSTFTYNLTYNKSSSDSRGWLDFISVQFRRHLIMSSNFVQFRDTKSTGAGNIAKYNIQNANNSTIIWDITNRTNYKKINGNLNNTTLTFNSDASELREYIAFNPVSSFPSPIYKNASNVGLVTNQNLHSLSPVDLIIVTHPNFYAQAQQIKNIHETYDNYSSIIVKPEEIYNEFSSGTPDISAIRNFVKMLYDRANTDAEIPKNILLVGDGSYDNKSSDPTVTNFIPTYQPLQSLTPISAVSDDFYVLLDEGEGNVTGSEDLDMGVGRLPVKTVEEAQHIVNKMNAYYGPQSYGNWKNILCFIADDFDKNETVHQADSERLTSKIDTNHPVYNIDKIYLDDYQQIVTIQGQRYPEVNQAINDRVNSGALLINWIGHGNEKGWAHEIVLTLSMIQNWNNKNKYPIFVAATCSFAPFDNHEIVSGGEMVLLNPNGGGIAIFSTTRLAYASGNYALLDKFYNIFLQKDDNNSVYSLGESTAFAKNNLPGNSNKLAFTLLGSPALRPSIPKYDIKTTKINGIDVSGFNDTISSQSLVTIDGAIYDNNGSIIENFNGIVNPTVYDKRMEYTTQANDGFGPLTYTAQKNILFNGQASVVNGKFSFSFVVPIDITYFYDYGKISYYAYNTPSAEAHGYDNSFIIGGSSDNPVTASEEPIIELFMNNEQFIHGGITDENPILLANLYSEVGINTVGSGIGHDITMTLNDNTGDVVVLNNFYTAEIDDFRSGKIEYQLSDLELGPHTLKLKAWDVLNNSAETFTDFIVANSSELVIEHIFNYPNPFSTSTEFYFAHNQPNTQLDVLIQIFTLSGKHIKTIDATVMSDGFRSHPIAWNARDEYGDKLAKGVYIYKLKVREPNGNMIEKFEKLVILN